MRFAPFGYRIWVICSLIIAAAMLVGCGQSPAPVSKAAPAKASGSVADKLRPVAGEIDNALKALEGGNLAQAQKSYEAFDQGWDKVEDDVKAKSASAYKAIEDAMDGVKAALTKADKPDPTRAREALTKLKQTIEANLPSLS